MPRLSFSSFNCVRMPRPHEAGPSVVWPLETVLAGVASAGLGHIGLDLFTVRDFLEGGREEADVGSHLSDNGLACSDVGALIVTDLEETAASAAELARLAAATGARLCTTALLVPPDRAAVDTLRRCSELLAEHDVRMAVEFCPYTPLPTLAAARDVSAAVGWERCGILVDSWQFFRSRGDLRELAALSGEQIAYVHFNDAPEPIGDDLQYESRHRRRLPGDGVFDLDRFAAAVLDTGFDGVVSLEVLADDFQALEPAEQARRAILALERYWGNSQPISDPTRRSA